MASDSINVNDSAIVATGGGNSYVASDSVQIETKVPEPLTTRMRDVAMGSMALIDQVVVSGTSFLTVVLVARFCSQFELGIFSLAWTVVGFWRTAQERMLSAPYLVFAHRSETDSRSFLGSSLTHQACLAVFASIVTVGCAVFFAVKGNPVGMSSVMALLIFSLPFLMLRDHIRSVCSAHFRYDVSLAINVTISATQIGAIGLLWWMEKVSIPAVIFCLGIACFVPTVVWLVRRPQAFNVSRTRVRADWTLSWAYSKWLVAARIAGMAGYFLVPWIVVYVMDADAAGAFAACTNLVGLSLMFITGMNNFFQPRTVRAYHDAGVGAMKTSLIETVVVFGAALAMISLAYFIAGGWLLENIYGAGFAGFGMVTFYLSLSILAVCVSIASGNGLAALGKPKGYFWGELAYCCISIVLAVVLIPSYGLYGAAWALVGGGVAASLITAITLARLIQSTSRRDLKPTSNEWEN